MANVNIPDLTALTAPATADVIEVYDDSAAQNKSLALSYLVRADGNGPQITGGGTIALGGNTLTVPATGTAALLATAQTFTAAQKFGAGAGTAQVAIKSQAAGTVGLIVDSAASPIADIANFGINGSTAVSIAATGAMIIDAASAGALAVLSVRRNGVQFARIEAGSDYQLISMSASDNGTKAGNSLTLQRNSNATTPAAAFITMQDKNAANRRIWVDGSGNVRINVADPTNANDTAGTVVGTQTSQAATKDILGDGVSPADALAAVLAAPVYRFRYKSGAYNNTEFHGITTDDSPQFGMDKGRVFNPVSAFGYMVQTIKALHARIQQLEEQITNG